MDCQFLVNAGLYESHEEAIKREEVLGRLDQVTCLNHTLSFSQFFMHKSLILDYFSDCEDMGEEH